jgi:WD40 repeat protein
MSVALELRHSPENAVAVTADGRGIVSGSWDTTLRLWDLESGQTISTLARAYGLAHRRIWLMSFHRS